MLYVLLCIKLFFFNGFFFFFDNIFFDNIFTYVYLFSTKFYVYIIAITLLQFFCIIAKQCIYYNPILVLLFYYSYTFTLVFFKLIQFKFFSYVIDISFFFYINNTNFFFFQSFPLFSSIHSILIVSLIYSVTVLLIALFNCSIFFIFKKNYEYDQFKNYIFSLSFILVLGSLWTFYNSYQYLFWNWDAIELITLFFFFCFLLNMHNFIIFAYYANFVFLNIFFIQLFRNFFFLSSHHINLENFEKQSQSLFWYNSNVSLSFFSSVSNIMPTVYVFLLGAVLILKKIPCGVFLLIKNKHNSSHLDVCKLLVVSLIFYYFFSNLLLWAFKLTLFYYSLLYGFFFIFLLQFVLIAIFFYFKAFFFLFFLNVSILLLFHFDLYVLFFIFFFFVKLISAFKLFDYLLYNNVVSCYTADFINFNCIISGSYVFYNYKLFLYKFCKLKFYLYINYYSIFKYSHIYFLYYAFLSNFFFTHSFLFFFLSFIFFYNVLVFFMFINIFSIKFFNVSFAYAAVF